MQIAVLQPVSLQTETGTVVVLVLLGCALTYLALRAVFSRELRLLQAQLEELKAATAAKRTEVAEVPKAMAAAAGVGASSLLQPCPEVSQVVTEVRQPVTAESSEEPSEEILVLIAAAVSAFLGKRARVRHTRLVHSEGVSPWAQQGRVFVQASHNLGVSHHG
jgi:methylmalonyl-CoA carboxyltransferase large subunit